MKICANTNKYKQIKVKRLRRSTFINNNKVNILDLQTNLITLDKHKTG
jgi:hypothetical protein